MLSIKSYKLTDRNNHIALILPQLQASQSETSISYILFLRLGLISSERPMMILYGTYLNMNQSVSLTINNLSSLLFFSIFADQLFAGKYDVNCLVERFCVFMYD